MSIRSYFMAKLYDASMKKMEKACLGQWRAELLAGTHGRVLEIGSGTGVNVSHYPSSVDELVLTEPDPHMLAILKTNAGAARCEPFPADALDFPDGSFDCVVSTLVLCSVTSPEKTLQEICRVLKPGGKLFFIEHVKSRDSAGLRFLQTCLQPFWRCACGNCHLTRDTEATIFANGFALSLIDRLRATGAPMVASPFIKGVAQRI